MIISSFLDGSPRRYPSLFGSERKYQMCATGTVRLICPTRSLRTFFSVTSTPQRSQTIPLYRIRLYFPQAHSKSLQDRKYAHKTDHHALVCSTIINRFVYHFTLDSARIVSCDERPIEILLKLMGCLLSLNLAIITKRIKLFF